MEIVILWTVIFGLLMFDEILYHLRRKRNKKKY